MNLSGFGFLSERFDPGEGRWHAHRRAQLIHASEGVLTVKTEQGYWVVPPQRGVWILPGVAHQVSSRKGFWLRTLYAEPGAAALPDSCRVVSIDPLVEQLLIAASEFGIDYPSGGPQERLLHVIVDRLPSLSVAPLHLPQPAEPRLRRLAAALMANPADERMLEALAATAGFSGRTAARLFTKETGLSFQQWRRQLRLLAALERLGEGENVTAVAFAVGYEDASSFTAMFKTALGETPARYFRAATDGETRAAMPVHER